MLHDGMPIAMKYKMDRFWHKISDMQKQRFYESYNDVPYWWKKVKIDPKEGEKILHA